MHALDVGVNSTQHPGPRQNPSRSYTNGTVLKHTDTAPRLNKKPINANRYVLDGNNADESCSFPLITAATECPKMHSGLLNVMEIARNTWTMMNTRLQTNTEHTTMDN